MTIETKRLILRDPVESDVEDEIRWWTEETAWQQWETPESIAAFPGPEALAAFIRYLIAEGCRDIYTQTYSANVRMLGLAKKLGFAECRRENAREVRGEAWDDVTLRLDKAAFEALAQ